jgi:hypothetical protein
MTNEQAGICILTSQEILGVLLVALVGADAAAELIAGTVTTAAPAGIVGDHVTIKATYDGSPGTFVDTQQNIDDLDDVVDGIVDITVGDFAAQSGDAYDALQESATD